MQRKSIIGALLLVGIGVVLGTTVFRTDIAQATGLAQSVTVNNTPANPVPVREQGTVTTQPAAPSNAFNVGIGDGPIDGCGAGLPSGTKWFVSSFGATNAGPDDGYAEVSVGNFTTGFQPELFIEVKAGTSSQQTFPQPFVITSPQDGDCLQFQRSSTVYGTIVGYRN